MALVTLVNSRDICQFLNADPHKPRIRQSTLRTWAARGRLTVHGKDGRHNLYDRDEVLRLVAARDTPPAAVTESAEDRSV